MYPNLKHSNNIFIYINKDTKDEIIIINNILSKKVCHHIHSKDKRHWEVAWVNGDNWNPHQIKTNDFS